MSTVTPAPPAPPQPVPAGPRGRRPRTRLLPRAVHLPESAWRGRHQAVCLFGWLLTAAVVTWAALVGSAQAVTEAAVLLAATALTAVIPARRRRAAASAASLTLLLATAMLVHLSGGVSEVHFLFFVIVAAVALYQQWAPFLCAVAFVVLHHGVVGTVHPEATYNYPAAIEHPWLWAGIHGGFVALASAVGLAAWRFEESVRGELRRSGEHTRVVLDSVGDAVLALAADGTVVTGNVRAEALLRAPLVRLTGRHVHDVAHPRAPHAAAACPLAGAGVVPDPDQPWSGTDEVHPLPDAAPTVPVAYRLSAVATDAADGTAPSVPTAAVLTLTDVSATERALVAERRLRRLSAERLAERAEVEQLAASVSPAPLDVAGVAVAACYVPASEALLGGDLYDWFVAPDGVVHVTVVDAMGKGRGATRHALAVVHALRVLALDGQPVEEVLARAGQVLTDHDDALMATAVVARYQPATSELVVASAGHPPALVVRHDGRSQYLETVGIGLGVPGAGSLGLATTSLGAGDTLVLYSDGLIEGTRDLGRGLADLARTAAVVAAEPPARMVERLVREPVSVARDDDRVAVALRRT